MQLLSDHVGEIDDNVLINQPKFNLSLTLNFYKKVRENKIAQISWGK